MIQIAHINSYSMMIIWDMAMLLELLLPHVLNMLPIRKPQKMRQQRLRLQRLYQPQRNLMVENLKKIKDVPTVLLIVAEHVIMLVRIIAHKVVRVAVKIPVPIHVLTGQCLILTAMLGQIVI